MQGTPCRAATAPLDACSGTSADMLRTHGDEAVAGCMLWRQLQELLQDSEAQAARVYRVALHVEGGHPSRMGGRHGGSRLDCRGCV